MEKIFKELYLEIRKKKAFQKFVHEFNSWWPKEYTWSQSKLNETRIDPQKDGLCTEIGPHGFRCDWGRVTYIIEGEKIALKWQISPKRIPVPDPDHASDVVILFEDNRDNSTVKLEHSRFENHGEDAEYYRKIMDDEQGWDYMLRAYKKYTEQ